VVIGKSVIVFNQAVIESFQVIGDNLVHFSFREKPHYTVSCRGDNYMSVPCVTGERGIQVEVYERCLTGWRYGHLMGSGGG